MTPIDVVYVLYGVPHLTLLSVLHLIGSTPHPLRFLFVDNGAQDPARTSAALARCFPGHRYLPRENDGVYRAINAGLREVESDWVMFASSDLFVLPGWFDSAALLLREHAAGWVGPAQTRGDYAARTAYETATALSEQREFRPHLLESSHALLNWALLQERVGWFDERFFLTYGDTDYAERMLHAGVLFGTVYPPAAHHLGQQSRTAELDVERNIAVEMLDEQAFHEKWRAHPDVIARHPAMGTYEQRLLYRQTKCPTRAVGIQADA